MGATWHKPDKGKSRVSWTQAPSCPPGASPHAATLTSWHYSTEPSTGTKVMWSPLLQIEFPALLEPRSEQWLTQTHTASKCSRTEVRTWAVGFGWWAISPLSSHLSWQWGFELISLVWEWWQAEENPFLAQFTRRLFTWRWNEVVSKTSPSWSAPLC